MQSYPMHGGAKVAYYVAGALTCLLVITLPIGIWMLVRAARGRVEVSAEGVVQHGLTTVRMPFAQIQRLGILEIPIAATGIGGFLARKKCGGKVGINLCIQTPRGKTRKFVASMYTDYAAMIQQVVNATGRQPETLTMGMLGAKWPELAA